MSTTKKKKKKKKKNWPLYFFFLFFSLNSFKHQRRCSVQQWSVNNICVASNPADIGYASMNIARTKIKQLLVSQGCICEITSSRVNQSLFFKKKKKKSTPKNQNVLISVFTFGAPVDPEVYLFAFVTLQKRKAKNISHKTKRLCSLSNPVQEKSVKTPQ